MLPSLPLKFRRKSLSSNDFEDITLVPSTSTSGYAFSPASPTATGAYTRHDLYALESASSASSSPIAHSALLPSSSSSPVEYAHSPQIRYNSSPVHGHPYGSSYTRAIRDDWKHTEQTHASKPYYGLSRYQDNLSPLLPSVRSSFSYSSPSEIDDEWENPPLTSDLDVDDSEMRDEHHDSDDLDLDEELLYSQPRRISFSTSCERDSPFVRPGPCPHPRSNSPSRTSSRSTTGISCFSNPNNHRPISSSPPTSAASSPAISVSTLPSSSPIRSSPPIHKARFSDRPMTLAEQLSDSTERLWTSRKRPLEVSMPVRAKTRSLSALLNPAPEDESAHQSVHDASASVAPPRGSVDARSSLPFTSHPSVSSGEGNSLSQSSQGAPNEEVDAVKEERASLSPIVPGSDAVARTEVYSEAEANLDPDSIREPQILARAAVSDEAEHALELVTTSGDAHSNLGAAASVDVRSCTPLPADHHTVFSHQDIIVEESIIDMSASSAVEGRLESARPLEHVMYVDDGLIRRTEQSEVDVLERPQGATESATVSGSATERASLIPDNSNQLSQTADPASRPRTPLPDPSTLFDTDVDLLCSSSPLSSPGPPSPLLSSPLSAPPSMPDIDEDLDLDADINVDIEMEVDADVESVLSAVFEDADENEGDLSTNHFPSSSLSSPSSPVTRTRKLGVQPGGSKRAKPESSRASGSKLAVKSNIFRNFAPKRRKTVVEVAPSMVSTDASEHENSETEDERMGIDVVPVSKKLARAKNGSSVPPKRRKHTAEVGPVKKRPRVILSEPDSEVDVVLGAEDSSDVENIPISSKGPTKSAKLDKKTPTYRSKPRPRPKDKRDVVSESSATAEASGKTIKKGTGPIRASSNAPKARASSSSLRDSHQQSHEPEPSDTSSSSSCSPLPHDEMQGMLIEALATSRASSLPASMIYTSMMGSRPALKDALNTSGAVMSRKEWLRVVEDALEDGCRASGVFGKVDSGAVETADHPLEAQWFYVPDSDPDQDRAMLIKSMMPRPAKRSETKKRKQYYWKPLGKLSRWDPEDEI